jgi:release factor glutamine methyltransferase|uniref:peptide chain release factor N(5)-glutamine methyltransferase n=1 Tax=Polynucleobacter sp. TaxID=2029855 RepID=UPI004047ED0D
MSANQSLRALLSNTALPTNEARILLAHLLEKHYQLPRTALLSRDEMTLNSIAMAEWVSLEKRRLNGEPIAYLVEKKSFYNIDLQVGPSVLIPRPETEILVDLAINEIKRRNTPTRVLDLGTGSGAIALAIAQATPLANVIATDQSIDALHMARRNAEQLGLNSKVRFAQGDWYGALDIKDQFDVILSNPPYIAALDHHLSEGDLRFEPASALTDHANGLSCLEVIISQASQYLHSAGFLAVEHGFDQSNSVVELMKTAGLREIQVHLDLAGHHRAVSAKK